MDARAIAELLSRCQAGDQTAWDALVDAYWQRLFGYALRVTGNAELAQDLVQETFLRIVQRLGKYDDQGKFEAWLFRILVNLVRDHGRSRLRHPTQSTVIESDGERIEMTDELAAKVPAPHEPLHHREDVDALQVALRKLPEGDRQILMLRHFADMPFKDIARTLNCPIGTVLARAHRALGKLRSMMEVSHDKTESQ
ncbi:MAG: sigma-70 family RNA polymerase sigma factor [Phycisphaerales bacterium]|nr:sigma-70 family RNA polymerase sigma factor [Phycisphaerales bacterium]